MTVIDGQMMPGIQAPNWAVVNDTVSSSSG
jgi:hypothetical protein